MMKRIQNKHQNGFTIVELMIATIVFSMVLLVCSYAIIHVGRMYYKGVIMGRTQDTSRKIVDDINERIVYNKVDNLLRNDDGQAKSICFGKVRYTYVIGKQLGSASAPKHVLWRDDSMTDGLCSPLDLSVDNPSLDVNGNNLSRAAAEMIGENMRLSRFDILEPCDPASVPAGCPAGSMPDAWSINISVSYGEDADFDLAAAPDFSVCKGINAGGQFCAVSSYSTTVKSRL